MTTEQRTERFRRAVNALRSRGDLPPSEGIPMGPANAHAAVTRQMVEDLADDVAELRSDTRRLLGAVAGAVVIDVVLRIAGVS